MANLLRQPLTQLARASLRPRAFPSTSAPPLLLSFSSVRFGSNSSAPLQRTSEIKDEQIPHKIITLVDPSTGSLLPPASLSSLLSQLDRTRFSLILADPSHNPPIVRILDKKEAYKKAQAKKEKAKDKKKAQDLGAASGGIAPGPAKEVQLSWATSAHDLSHKLGKARELLEKRGKVNVVLVNKKGQPGAREEHKVEVQAQVEQALEGAGKLAKVPTVNGGQTLLEFVRA